MSELNKCRRRLNKVYNEIGTITVEILTLQYRINTIFGEDCGIDKSIVHRVLKYFGLA
ncbi:hypothetical protein SORBI_3001G087300 [Sorghum bicolor]|uniref:Uncharacterized protein n=1 Tax=Sorghum bicolor TaxID=4558 RepID=A0A1B6QI20_SORBI|nr:hypothetical protein SORBI_3001G087300 [Sorghum bicolor]